MTLEDIMARIDDVHALVETLVSKRQAPAAAPQRSAPFSDEPVPQPDRKVDGCHNVEIHFGTNKGRRLEELTDNSLSFYAAKWELRPKPDGSFWENDVRLLNAARTYWHLRRKTLKTAAPAPAKPAPKEKVDEDVPF